MEEGAVVEVVQGDTQDHVCVEQGEAGLKILLEWHLMVVGRGDGDMPQALPLLEAVLAAVAVVVVAAVVVFVAEAVAVVDSGAARVVLAVVMAVVAEVEEEVEWTEPTSQSAKYKANACCKKKCQLPQTWPSQIQ